MENVVSDLKSIMSEAGATGYHMIYEAQVINHDWPRELRGNGDPICGYLPEDASKAGGYSYAYQLKPHEFHYDGQRFLTWDMKKYAWQVLGMIQPAGARLIAPPKTSNEDANARTEVTNDGSLNTLHQRRTTNERTNQKRLLVWRFLHPLCVRSFVLMIGTMQQSNILKYIQKPNILTGARRWHCSRTDGREYTAFKGGLSQRLFHSYSPKGKMRNLCPPSSEQCTRITMRTVTLKHHIMMTIPRVCVR